MEITYTVTYAQEVVVHDIPRLPTAVRRRVRIAIETKLTSSPELFGKPLRRSLKGYRKLRVGDYRIIFRIDAGTVKVFVIGHRKDVYNRATNRVQ